MSSFRYIKEICILSVIIVCALVIIKLNDGQSYNKLIKIEGNSVYITNDKHEYMIVSIDDVYSDNRYIYYIENDGFEHKILINTCGSICNIDVYSKDKNKEPELEYCVTYRSDNSKGADYIGSSYNVEIDKYADVINDIIRENNWDENTEYSEVWKYFKNSYKYDYDTAEKIENGEIDVFLPNLETVYTYKSGICYDIASLMTCVCRELYGEARLCIGTYDGDKEGVYHAWCELKHNGEWVNLDTIKKQSISDDNNKYSIKETY